MLYKPKGKENQADLQERLEHSLTEWYPTCSQSLISILVQRKTYRWSEHLIYQIMEGDVPFKKILVKLPNTHFGGNRQQEIDIPSEVRVRLEYEALTSLYEHLDCGERNGIIAVRPLAHYSDMDALVLEYLPGIDFLSILKNAGAFFGIFSNQKVANKTAFDAGRLLAYLHQVPHEPFPKVQTLDESFLKSSLDGKKERLLTLSPYLLVENQIHYFQNLIPEYFGKVHVEVVTTKLHGDYYPENIVLLPDHGVFTIDTPLYQVGPVEQDIAKFMVGTAITKRYLLYGSAGMDKTVAFNLNQAFLKGYQSIGKYDCRVLLVFQFLGIMQRWIEVLEVLANRLPHVISTVLNEARIMPLILEDVASLRKNMEMEM